MLSQVLCLVRIIFLAVFANLKKNAGKIYVGGRLYKAEHRWRKY